MQTKQIRINGKIAEANVPNSVLTDPPPLSYSDIAMNSLRFLKFIENEGMISPKDLKQHQTQLVEQLSGEMIEAIEDGRLLYLRMNKKPELMTL